MPTDFLSVLRAFQDAQVRYVLVGGLAVLLHGVDRLTADIDLIVDLAPEQASRAIETLLAGYRPVYRLMRALGFWDPQNRCPTVDVFAEYPMDFEKLFSAAVLMPLSGTNVRVASIHHLIELKRAAGRPRDLEDAARLSQMHEGKGP